MRRATILVALLSLLACAAVAVAATPRAGTFKAGKGDVQLGYDLKFKVAGGKIKGLVANVLEDCGGSMSTVTTIAPDVAWKVKGGRFSGRRKETYENVVTYVTLEGRFTSPTTARGTIRQESIVVGTGASCDTYKLKFTARRGG